MSYMMKQGEHTETVRYIWGIDEDRLLKNCLLVKKRV